MREADAVELPKLGDGKLGDSTTSFECKNLDEII